MKALVYTRRGGPETLQIESRPDLTPAANEVVVAVHRAGVNFSDIAARVGLYPDAPPFPFVSGYEVSGRVAQVGNAVTEFAVGDPVVAIMTKFGGQATQAAVSVANTYRIPSGVSDDAAAALPVNYLTAFHMLRRVAPLQPGMKLFIQGAAGGVGLAAIQIAKQVKDVEIYGTASAGKHEFLRKEGVHFPIDYRTVDYLTEVRRLTDGKGVHVVLDPRGGGDWRKGYELLRPTGHLICYGWSNMVSGESRNYFKVIAELLRMPRFSPIDMMNKNRGVSGVNLGHLWGEREMLRAHFTELLQMLAAGTIRPYIDSVIPLARAADAHRRIQQGLNVGKVLLDCTG